ncbi:hypothetical protein AB0K60_35055 [Thermopolyspora sp. NPDC052614]|uniref:hypothetical protein n=1 Tax=Thermopolyspora sp. NPDC052614 TaxID=3155682 RepID=UPI00343A636B
MSSDLKGYGRSTDKKQEFLQAGFVAIHRQAAEVAGLRRDEWVIQEGGDGELAVLPATESEPAVVDAYMRALARALRERNEGVPAADRLRLRIAVAFGTAYPASNGFAGQAVVEASRLVSSGTIKRILEDQEKVNLLLILSQRVFDDLVRQEHTSYRPDDFVNIHVHEKEYEGSAWVWTPDVDISVLRSYVGHRRDDAPAGHGPAQTVTYSQRAKNINNFTGSLDARGSVFGVSEK